MLIKACILVAVLCGFSGAAQSQQCSREDMFLASTLAPPPSVASWRSFESEARDVPTGSVDLLLVGDSLAADWGRGAYSLGSVYNYGVRGDSTQHVLWRLQEPNLSRLEPKNILVIVGTNNLGGGENTCGVVAGVRAVFSRLTVLWPKANIVYLEITPRGGDFKFANAERIAINSQLSKTENIKTVNVDDEISCGFTVPCQNYLRDNLHFSATGYQLLSREIAASIGAKIPE